MNYSSLALLASVILLLRFLQKFFNSWYHRHLPFPPGPTPFPLIGNFHDLPTKFSWLTYTKWGMQYGSDLVHASTLGQHIVVVNSIKTAVELFEKRSHIHSDRPVITMIELIGWESNVAFMPMGDRWRKHRRMLQQHFRRDMSRNYHTIQMKKVHQLLQGLLSSPQAFREHLKTRVKHYFCCQKLKTTSSESVFPGAAAVNTFPILRYLPSWMPGAGFQRFAAAQYGKIPSSNYSHVVHRHFQRDGVDSKSVVAKLLEASQARGRDDEAAIQEVAAVAYGAGADTTVSALASFFLAMATHPDVQKRAQIEIDTVVGTHRLPGFEDRSSLPYVEAVYREVLRWRPVLPLGVAHASSADDIYNGYFIPKGATVISNIWAMTRDESIYSDPERFDPERFFTADGKLNDDDTILAFGFGRRICVGRHTADASVWATIVSVLSTYNIAKAKDDTGKEIDIDPGYSDGMITQDYLLQVYVLTASLRLGGLGGTI
ncbi:cytochrome P450 [Mycena sanguinolenta]|nr:cytochrome P450 [Mycena sanguinolenta]